LLASEDLKHQDAILVAPPANALVLLLGRPADAQLHHALVLGFVEFDFTNITWLEWCQLF
jgi:hypothetical protein